MSVAAELLAAVRTDFPGADQLLVQAVDPGHKSRRFLYLYAGDQPCGLLIEHDHAAAARAAWEQESAAVTALRLRLASSTCAAAMLTPLRTLERAGRLYILSRFEPPARRFTHARTARERRAWVTRSSDWLLHFQQQTRVPETLAATEAMRDAWPADDAAAAARLMPIAEALRRAAATLGDAVLPCAGSHGDFLHWNYFEDGAGRFRVIDWEAAAPVRHVAHDYFLNLALFAVAGSVASRLGGGLRTLAEGPAPRDPVAAGLASALTRFGAAYAAPPAHLRTYLLYGYLCLLRRNRGVESLERTLRHATDFLALAEADAAPHP